MMLAISNQLRTIHSHGRRAQSRLTLRGHTTSRIALRNTGLQQLRRFSSEDDNAPKGFSWKDRRSRDGLIRAGDLHTDSETATLEIKAVPLLDLLGEVDNGWHSAGRDAIGHEDIPQWASEGDPIWLTMMQEFLFHQRPQCILLDVDQQPLPIFQQHTEGVLSQGEFNSFESGRADHVLEIPEIPSLDDMLSRDFRYLHVPRVSLRSEMEHFDRHEPLAIFGGSTECSRQAEALLREEGFTRICNVHTYRYLRQVCRICATRGGVL